MADSYLEVDDGSETHRVPLRAEPVNVGRHSDNTLVLNDGQASRFHCVIEPGNSSYVVRDLKSRNGTRVNGHKIEVAELSPGDTIHIGATQLRLITPELLDDDIFADDFEDIGDLDELTDDDIVESPAFRPAAMDRPEDPERCLEQMARTLPEHKFGETDIAMLNARDRVVHPAGATRTGKREPADLLRLLLLVCFRSHTTDVHLEPKSGHFQLRLRIDGSMVDVCKMEQQLGTRLSAVVKILSDIDPAKRDIIQEGHFAAMVPDDHSRGERRVDFRVSFAPSVYGQKLVIRLLDASTTPDNIEDLRLPGRITDVLRQAILQDAGMILVCGPTGSGKTTTLYALVRSMDLMERNVVTIEDPVEIQLPGVTQLPVNEDQGKTFASLLRSVLRQDPDAILVGEIRDAETARTAMQSAITGHLVYSTVHTKDTAGTIYRLIDLGCEPYLVAQGLQVVIGQRLARQLCPNCKRSTSPTDEQTKVLKEAGHEVSEIFEPVGCGQCLGTGYSGRRPFFELMTSSEALRDVIQTNPAPAEIRKVLKETGQVLLDESGFELVARGVTSYDEIDKSVRRDMRLG